MQHGCKLILNVFCLRLYIPRYFLLSFLDHLLSICCALKNQIVLCTSDDDIFGLQVLLNTTYSTYTFVSYNMVNDMHYCIK